MQFVGQGIDRNPVQVDVEESEIEPFAPRGQRRRLEGTEGTDDRPSGRPQILLELDADEEFILGDQDAHRPATPTDGSRTGRQSVIGARISGKARDVLIEGYGDGAFQPGLIEIQLHVAPQIRRQRPLEQAARTRYVREALRADRRSRSSVSEAAVAGVDLPCDIDRAALARQRTMLGGIRGQLVQRHSERQSAFRMQCDRRTRDTYVAAVIPEVRSQLIEEHRLQGDA